MSGEPATRARWFDLWVRSAHLAVVPDLARLQVAATATRYLCDSGLESHELRGMALARPEVRIGDPLIEFADRVRGSSATTSMYCLAPHAGALGGRANPAVLRRSRHDRLRSPWTRFAHGRHAPHWRTAPAGRRMALCFSYDYNQFGAPLSVSRGHLQTWLRFAMR
jgi:hypothetical protein